MASLSDKQFQFAKMVARLILYAEFLGYKVTLGEAYAYPEDGRHIENSTHYHRLGIDINLFIDGKYITETIQYSKLGEFWEEMGGSWGGRFSDGNHFSLKHQGVK